MLFCCLHLFRLSIEATIGKLTIIRTVTNIKLNANIGDNTHHHDHVITFNNFSVIKITVNAVGKLILLLVKFKKN